MEILLLTGQTMQLDEREWPVLTSLVLPRGGSVHRLTVRRHADGDTLVYGTEEVEGTGAIKAGGAVVGSDVDASDAVKRVAAKLNLSHFLIERCLRALRANQT